MVHVVIESKPFNLGYLYLFAKESEYITYADHGICFVNSRFNTSSVLRAGDHWFSKKCSFPALGIKAAFLVEDKA